MIYFIQEGRDGPIKIGYTQKTGKSRLGNLQIGNCRELHVIKEIDGGEPKAWELYHRFHDAHIRGEWFNPTDDLILFITKGLSRMKPKHQNLLHPKLRQHIDNLRPLDIESEMEIKEPITIPINQPIVIGGY